MRTGRLLWLAGAALALSVGCGGSKPAHETTPAALDDSALGGGPARSVPQASDLVREGEQKLQEKDPEAARALFEQAIEQHPDDARAHLDLGIVQEMLGQPEAAETSYRRAIELSPDLSEAQNNLAVLLRARGELSEAIALLSDAVEHNPDSAAARTNLALALEDKGDYEGSERAYRAALAIEPEALMTRINLGLLLVDMGKHDEARRMLHEASDAAQQNRAALLAIGNGLRRAGDAQGAVAAMRAATETGGEPTPALLSELSLAELAAGDRGAAIATVQRALALDERYATGHYLLANMLAASGKREPARKHYKRYLALEPEGPYAARAKERLAILSKTR